MRGKISTGRRERRGLDEKGRALDSAQAATELRFDPPGEGTWTLDPVHFPRPVTRYWMEMHPEPFKRGFREFTSYYGMLLDTVEYHYINGFVYGQRRPVSDEEAPRRFQRAGEVWEGKLWRDQLYDWDQNVKPESITTHRELQSVDSDELSDADLTAHLKRCRDRHAEMIYQHMRFTGAAIVSIGDLLAHAGEWTDASPSELLELMRGTAPTSAGASIELGQLTTALAKDDAARALLESDGDPQQVLDELRGLDSDAGRAVSAYLDLVGYRLLDGFDIAGRYALELPDALLRSIRATLDGGARGSDDVDERIAAIRSQVPEQHRGEFDELLEEARLMYRIRDERGVFSDIWASGIMRRAALAAGRRLAEKGRIQDAEHFIDAGFEEMCALLEGADEPSAEELAGRFEWRTSHSAKDAPPILGPLPPPDPDPSGLPPAAARMMQAVGISMGALFGSSEAPHEEDLLRGLAASGGVYEGPARRIAGPDEFDRIVQGDVLVTQSTTEAFNILLPLLGAIVTDSGGLLSHSAIVAREYGIPGVVGTREATERIPDGATVRVDGDAGEVTVGT
jgi:phosphohistidine swiveling domain-containing protein